jgi:signal transduction histidine kinase
MGTHVRTLGALVDDLFELSRLDAGDFTWTTEAVPLAELIAEMVNAMRTEADAKGVAMRWDVATEIGFAQANAEKVERVLLNLLQNAIRHTPPDGSVVVRAEHVGGQLEIEIADTGDGISAADRPRVFEPFYRGGNEAARTRAGSGLGLAISRAIVEAHGGRIWLADAPKGTSVRFTLPIASG